MNPPKTPAEVASALSLAVNGSALSAVMVGVAAFVAAAVYKGYPEGLRKQIVVTHANLVWEMLQRVETEEVKKAAEEDAQADAEAEALEKKWMQ